VTNAVVQLEDPGKVNPKPFVEYVNRDWKGREGEGKRREGEGREEKGSEGKRREAILEYPVFLRAVGCVSCAMCGVV
jgi:hypothetical protein